jgi:hypothetical protein
LDISKPAQNQLYNRREIFLGFIAIAFPIQVWAIINILREVPAWILRLSFWDMWGVISYTLAYALIESVIICILFVTIGVVLPKKYFRENFIAYTAIFSIFLSLIFIAVQTYANQLKSMGMVALGIMGFVLISIMLGSYLLIYHKPKAATTITSIVDRLVVLSILYLTIDFLAIITIIFRNLN